MRHPVVITTLEEDMKAIGLMEGDQEKLAPKADQEGGYSEEGDDKPSDEPDTVKKEGKKVGKVVKAGNPAGASKFAEGRKGEAEGDDDDDDELPPKAQEAISAIRSLSRNFLKTHEAVGPKPVGSVAESKKADKPKSRIEQLAEGKIYRSGKAKPATSRVASLLEEVATVVGDIHRARQEERIKGFANIAMIAEHLSDKFRYWGMALSEGGLFKVGRSMHRLAEDAAGIAQKIDEPPAEEPKADEPMIPGKEEQDTTDDKSVDDLFKKFMSKLLDALQLYNDVSGKTETDEDDDETEPEAEPELGPDGEPKDKEERAIEGDEEDEPAPDSDDEPEDDAEEGDEEDEPSDDDDDDDDEEESKDEDDDSDEDDDEEEPKAERAVEGDDSDDDDDDEEEDETVSESEDEEKDEDDEKGPYGAPIKDKEMSVGEARSFLADFRKRLTEAKSRKNEGRKAEGRKSEGRKAEGRKAEGRKGKKGSMAERRRLLKKGKK